MGGRVLVYGGKGALGNVIVETFKANQWWTLCVDVAASAAADASVTVAPAGQSWTEQAAAVTSGVEKALDGQTLDAVLCVAGGWAGGNAADKNFIGSCEEMWRQSVWTSCVAAQVAARHLKEGGLLQLTGAKAALDYTPTMMGYGMAKAAVHQLVQSLNSSRAGLPKNTTTIAILPVTLDTPANRQNMPKADHSTWTPLAFVAKLLFQWAESADSRPASGSMVELNTKNGETDMIIGQLQQPSKLASAY